MLRTEPCPVVRRGPASGGWDDLPSHQQSPTVPSIGEGALGTPIGMKISARAAERRRSENCHNERVNGQLYSLDGIDLPADMRRQQACITAMTVHLFSRPSGLRDVGVHHSRSRSITASCRYQNSSAVGR